MPMPDLSRVPEYYHRYINQVKEDELAAAFSWQRTALQPLLKNIPDDKVDHRYAEGKWSVKELLQHLIDAERIFAYRALCFARKDTTPLPGFDENMYADNCMVSNRDWNEMLDEFWLVRRTTEIMFNSFNNEQLDASGVASNSPTYVLGIGFIIAGHLNHHVAVLKERYLS
jgi:exoribonuclease II